MLKFALPCTSDKTIPCLPSGVSEWCVPYILKKLVDVDRLDILLAPLGDARVCKQPENKSKELPKAKAKGKAKQKGKKRSLADDDDDETITASIYGEDLLNAVNYTLEKVQPQHRKQACVTYALDLGILFALETNLDAAGVKPRITAWTKARKFIKCFLNRAHSLHARASDPDVALDLMNTLDQQDGEQDEKEEEDTDAGTICHQRLTSVLRVITPTPFTSFLENNFGDFCVLACLSLAFTD